MTHGGRYKLRKQITLTCAGCGGTFTATRPDAKYCAPSCRPLPAVATKPAPKRKRRGSPQLGDGAPAS